MVLPWAFKQGGFVQNSFLLHFGNSLKSQREWDLSSWHSSIRCLSGYKVIKHTGAHGTQKTCVINEEQQPHPAKSQQGRAQV